MSKTNILRILIPIMAVLIVFQGISGLEPLLIPYPMHQITGLVLIGCAVLHVYLNWGWIRTNLLKLYKPPKPRAR
jgi:hypothetical protein